MKSIPVFTIIVLMIQFANPIFGVLTFTKYTDLSFNGNLYTLVEEPMLNWTTAALACSQQNKVLTSIQSMEELQFLLDYVSKPELGKIPGPEDKDYAWVGGSNFGPDNLFRWLENGEVIPNQFWGSGEPDFGNSTRENCTDIWKMVNGLNDFDCSAEFRFVCSTKKEMPSTTTTVSTSEVPSTTITEEPEPTTTTPPASCEPTKETFSCEDKECGYYPDPEDPQSYFACTEDKKKVDRKPCPHGLYFNPTLKTCDHPTRVVCKAHF